MSEPFQPIRIMGVDADDVGSPRNDGTPGSGLYRVPIKLSRQPPREWAEAFPEMWNHPPRFTTMHRPGIASLSGDKIILDGTTVEEVRDHHSQTLTLVVEQLNSAQAKHDERAHADAKKAAEERSKHETNVRNVAGDIKFD